MERPKGSLKKFLAHEGGIIVKRYWPVWWGLDSVFVTGVGKAWRGRAYRAYSLKDNARIEKGLSWALEKESESLEERACRFWGSEDVKREMVEGEWYSHHIERKLNEMAFAKEAELESKGKEKLEAAP